MRVILVNIFGGITKCDEVAEGIISASKMLNLQLPLVVRLQGVRKAGRVVPNPSSHPDSSPSPCLPGTNHEEAEKKIVESGLKIHVCEGFSESAKLVRMCTRYREMVVSGCTFYRGSLEFVQPVVVCVAGCESR